MNSETQTIIIGLLGIEARTKQMAEYAVQYAAKAEQEVVSMLRLLWSREPEPRPPFDAWLIDVKRRHQGSVARYISAQFGGRHAELVWTAEAEAQEIEARTQHLKETGSPGAEQYNEGRIDK